MNVTTTASMALQTSEILDQVWSLLLATRAELFLFCVAVAAYMLLFGNSGPKSRTKGQTAKSKRIKVLDDVDDLKDDVSSSDLGGKTASPLSDEEVRQVSRVFASAFEANDYRQVLRCWNALKRSDKMPPVSLSQAVESMQRFKKDRSFVLRELKAYFKKYSNSCNLATINDLLDSLGKRLDSELVDSVIEMMPALGLKADQRTYEIQLSMQFTTRNFNEVKNLLETMASEKIPMSMRSTIVAVKTALKTGNFESATRHFRDLKAMWLGSSSDLSATPSNAPRHIVSQLVDLACHEQQLANFLPLLENVPISEDAVSSMLSECMRCRDPVLAKKVEQLIRTQGHQLSDATYTLLVKNATNDPGRVRKLFEEVVAQGTTISTDFALTMLAFCSQTRSLELADELYAYMKPKQIPVLSAFIRFYAATEQHEKACDVYEQQLLSGKIPGSQGLQQAVCLDARLERSLMNAAMRCGREELAKNFLDASPADIAKHITMIRNCAASGNLKGAMKVFETLKTSGTEVNAVVYNTVLDACVECRDLKAAEAWMAETKKAGLIDVVSYNTLIKAHLQNENFAKARSLVEEMRKEGLQPNRITFNELVNGLVTKGSSSQRAEIWSLVREMKAAGVKPNQVTCSILLKSLNSHSREGDILETMDLISAMDEPMDEVLLSSVVEACVRIGKPDLLSQKLKQLHNADKMCVSGSHTFGSLIKAYGHAKDIDSVWKCWKEMRSRHIRPTSITLGCMVEAVVSNGDTEGAYDLIHQMQEDDRCRDALNAVIYCSVLKGFTREKKLQRALAVYEEMVQRKVDLSIVTYNTLLDACARCNCIDRAPTILDDMREKGIEANLITYSTMVKGHCQAGDIAQGFAILETMKKDTSLKPDEIMYNSLLDGCAQNNLVEEGLSLLSRMENEGVVPSNFTLSLLVKLMNRSRKLDGAFALVEDISTRYNFRPNVHVYSNLIQACVANRQLGRGMETFEKMLKEHVKPESRTYAILVRASMTQGYFEQAAALLRAALGLPGSDSVISQRQASLASIQYLDAALVSETMGYLLDKGHAQDLAVPLLTDIKRLKPHFRLDSHTQSRVMSAGISGEVGGSYSGATYQGRNSKPRQTGRTSYNNSRSDGQRSWRA